MVVFDHIGFHVSDFEKAKDFFVQALKPLNIGITSEGAGWAMIGRKNDGRLWFGSFGPSPGPIHIAFGAETREQVRQFYTAAIAAGGKDNGGPGLRSNYRPNYYGAFVIGPDGHNVEAVCYASETEA
jgi:catechol 2,3-dioxygenase-like lactoylglutathione lyase family enzyme